MNRKQELEQRLEAARADVRRAQAAVDELTAARKRLDLAREEALAQLDAANKQVLKLKSADASERRRISELDALRAALQQVTSEV